MSAAKSMGDMLSVVGSRNGRCDVDAEELGAGLLRAQDATVQPGSVCAAQRGAGHAISITTRSTTVHGNLGFPKTRARYAYTLSL